MQSSDIHIGKKTAVGVVIELPNANLVMVHGTRGFVMCGYLNMAAAEKLKDAAALVTGVKTVDDLLAAKVVCVTKSAARMGVKPGMTGKAALAKFC